MKSYCLKCREDTENIKPRVQILVTLKQWYYQNVQYVVIKNPDFLNIKKQRTLSKLPILGDILFWTYKKMDEIVNKFLLAADKFMPEMHLKQPEFTYSACRPFTKIKERIRKFKETGDTNYI